MKNYLQYLLRSDSLDLWFRVAIPPEPDVIWTQGVLMLAPLPKELRR